MMVYAVYAVRCRSVVICLFAKPVASMPTALRLGVANNTNNTNNTNSVTIMLQPCGSANVRGPLALYLERHTVVCTTTDKITNTNTLVKLVKIL